MPISKLKYLLSNLSYYSGLSGQLARFILRNKALILMYHRIMDPADDIQYKVQHGMFVSNSTFRIHLDLVRSHFEVIPLQELVDRLQAGRDIGWCCSLTFDDGWLDNYQNAFPLLREFKLPATIFLATGYIGTNRWFWPEEISFCLSRIYQGKVDIDALKSSEKEIIKGTGILSGVRIEAALDSLIEKLKRYSSNERKKIVEKLIRSCGVEKEKERLLMNWDEVREMTDSGLVSFGSHTALHTLLNQLGENQIYDEIFLSKERLETEIDQQCKLFSYPNGDYNDVVLKTLKNIGLESAITTKRGFVSKNSKILELPRIGMHEDISCSLPLFYWRLLVG